MHEQTHALDEDSSVRLAEFLSHGSFETLPKDVVQRTKASILDTLGCALLGSANAELRPIREFVELSHAQPVSTILGVGTMGSSPENAVLCNCAGVHQFDFDDTLDAAPCHPSSGSVFASLALAEPRGGVSGKRWITAVALANELACRIGSAIHGKVHDYPWFRAPVVGIFGATAAAAIVLDCTPEEHVQALGITLPMVGGTFASLEHPGSDIRSVRDGIAYRNGVVAAHLAKRGLRGDQHAFDGPLGFFHAFFSGKYNREVLTKGLGTQFYGVSLKPWPSIRHVHTALTATKQLIDRHGLSDGDIAKVCVSVGAITRQRCGPVRRGGLPGSRMDLLGNLPFAIATMVTHGGMPLDVYRDNSLADQVIGTIERKVEWEFDPGLTVSGTFEPARVQVTTVGGRVHVAECEQALGHPLNPMPTQDRYAKFAACAQAALRPIDTSRISTAIKMIEELESVDDIAEVARLLA